MTASPFGKSGHSICGLSTLNMQTYTNIEVLFMTCVGKSNERQKTVTYLLKVGLHL